MDVEQHGSRRIGGVCGVSVPAGQAPQQEAIHGAEGQLAALRPGARAIHVVENPGDLGGGEIRIQEQSRLAGNQILVTVRPQRVAVLGGAPVLPDDGAIHRLAGAPVPDDGGLALVGDSNGGD